MAATGAVRPAVLVMVVLLGAGWARASASTGGALPPLLAVGYHTSSDIRSLQTLRAFGQYLSWVITTDLQVDATGRVSGTEDPEVFRAAQQHGAQVHARIANLADGAFSAEVVERLLTGSAARERAIAEIQAVLERGYTGIHIDFEAVPPRLRSALTSFLRELRGVVHARGATLSIAVPARTRDDPQDAWAGAFDLRALGRIADRVVIMAYDEHWEGSAPGPVASYPWVEAVVRFSSGLVPRHKLLLGVGLYGYVWSAPGAGRAIAGRDARDRAAREGVQIRWDGRARVPFYRSREGIVYFEDARSIGYKVELARRAGWAGVAAWRLGHEAPDLWTTLGPHLARVAQQPTSP